MISATFLGMNFGANSWPFAKNDFGTRGMTWTAAGGGGGGTTSSVFSYCGILMSCVKYSGNKMSTATTTLCPKTETTKSIEVRGFSR